MSKKTVKGYAQKDFLRSLHWARLGNPEKMLEIPYIWDVKLKDMVGVTIKIEVHDGRKDSR